MDALSDDAASRVRGALDDARRQLREQLESIPGDTNKAHRLRVSLYQAEVAAFMLRTRLDEVLSAVEREAHSSAMRDLYALIRNREGDFPNAAGIDIHIVERLSRREGLALYKYSTGRYSADVLAQMQRTIVMGVAAGKGQDEIARQLGGVFNDTQGRAGLIARMELCRAYNDAYLESLQGFNERLPRPEDPLNKRLEEFHDARNHPFSRVADQSTVGTEDPFKVSIYAVEEAAHAMGKSPKGVLWERVGGYYVGHNVPAHFGERGRIIGWRKSWGET